jgi:hypothetical protein
MSDTPRTDAEELPHSLDDHHFVVGSFFARKLERELNAANDRIKRLEEALECIREYWNRDNNNRAMIDACWYAIDKSSEALEAKEAKP